MGEELPGVGFAAQTAVAGDPVRPGRYLAAFGGQWNAPVAPQGGVVTAAAVRAMRSELDDPAMDLRSVSVMFAARVEEGPAVVEASVLRRGRSMAQASASLRSEGSANGLVAQAVFGRERRGFSFTDPDAPKAPPVDACVDVRELMASQGVTFAVPVMDRVEMRVPKALQGRAGAGESVSWFRLAEGTPLLNGFTDPLAFLPICDMMAGAIGQRTETAARPYISPSCDLTVHLVGRATSEWLLARSRAVHAADGYVSISQDLWDPASGLVARSTQTAFLVFP
ncbi:thioesterase superfamily protein [Actinocorallia herbida]|uniref:Thioesterase superfamily protein n=1 Tax=Actinocorallia herbida TaxID=58109 RepID=A0A3N1CZX1_9ACTN|nr:thioesterase family protein [Actinocorallia herbida]ROO86833.1 thioesterase superfamily protein [Actinocorallia herbida]